MQLNISNENKMVCIIFIYLRKKKEYENSRQYMLYIYEIIFPKDVRELPVNEIYKKNDPWNLYDKFRLSLLSRKLFYCT